MIRSLRTVISNSLDIESDRDYQQAADTLRDVATVKKSIDDRRKSVTKPLDAAKKAVQAMFRPMFEELGTARANIEAGMNGWEIKKEEEADKERDRELRKAEAQAKRLRTIANKKIANATTREEARDIRDDMKASQEAALSVGAAKESLVDGDAPKVAGVGVREVWDFEVEDLDEIPYGFCKPKEVSRSAVLAYAKTEEEQGETPAIQGIRFFKTKSRSVRSF